MEEKALKVAARSEAVAAAAEGEVVADSTPRGSQVRRATIGTVDADSAQDQVWSRAGEHRVDMRRARPWFRRRGATVAVSSPDWRKRRVRSPLGRYGLQEHDSSGHRACNAPLHPYQQR